MSIRYLLLVSSLLFVAASAITCGSRECPAGNACCADGIMGSTCFDPATHDCVEERRLCGEALGVCGSTCYDKSSYDCYDNSTLCPHGFQSCGTSSTPQCFDPSLYSCMIHPDGQQILISKQLPNCGGVGYNPGMNECDGGDIVDIPIQTNCSVGQKQCGSQCYDPVLYDCFSSTLVSKPGVCGVGLVWCSSQCYNPSMYNCVNGTLQLVDNTTWTCPSGQQSCGNLCYDSSILSCFAGNVLCGVGLLSCGPACYDNNRYYCMNQTLMGRPGYCAPELSLCGSRCYNASEFNCVRGVLAPVTIQLTCSSNTCPQGDQCCSDMVLGDVCYNPDTHDCVNSRRLCGNGLRACGTICFDSVLYACVTDNVITEKNRLCPANFNVCGNGQCYDPTKLDCVGDSHTLCPLGAPVCGGICYDQKNYGCVDGVLACRNCNGSAVNDSSDSSSGDSSSSGDHNSSSSDDDNNNNNSSSSDGNNSSSSSDGNNSSSSSDDNNSSSSSSSSDDDSSSDEVVVCIPGEKICGHKCYASDTHVCVGGIIYIICDLEELMCGTDFCYDAGTHNCTNGVVLPRISCIGNATLCGIADGPVYCYDSSVNDCVNGQVVPKIFCTDLQQICGSTCYSPLQYVCINHILVELNFTCTGKNFNCNSTGARCFDPLLYTCINDTLACTKACGDYCYDADESACVAGSVVGLIGCAANQLRCGPAINGICYVPSELTCVNNTLGCYDNKLLCGGTSCYNPTNSYCVNGTVYNYGSVASHGNNNSYVNVLLISLLISLVVLLW